MVSDDAVKLILALLALFVLLPFLVMAMMIPFGATMMGGTFGVHPGGWFGAFALVPLAVLLVFGWLGYRLFVGERDDDEALAELREAYARGDLTTEEFEERLERLREP
ncbi:MAG: SHOCT domain-containing protein [Halanaeroarchaeum sp.]